MPTCSSLRPVSALGTQGTRRNVSKAVTVLTGEMGSGCARNCQGSRSPRRALGASAWSSSCRSALGRVAVQAPGAPDLSEQLSQDQGDPPCTPQQPARAHPTRGVGGAYNTNPTEAVGGFPGCTLILRHWQKQEKNLGLPVQLLLQLWLWLLWSPPHLTPNVSSNGKRRVPSTGGH